LVRPLNPDATKGVEGEQVVVTRDDGCGAAIDSQCQDFIVPWVAAGGDGCCHLHPFGFAEERCGEAPHVDFIHLFSKLFPPEDIVQLGQ
jgi:hypothetical protein